MKRSRDPLSLSPQWHVDCRIEADLPEDNVVGTRFLINAVFTAAALAALLYAGQLGYMNLSLRRQIRDWDNRINASRTEVSEIRQMEREYETEAAKIDQAHALIHPQIYVSGFFTDLARLRPEQVAIDVIEWTDAGIAVRGSLAEKSERASQLLGDFVVRLQRDAQIAPLFREITLRDLDRATTGDTLRFEIIFLLKNRT